MSDPYYQITQDTLREAAHDFSQDPTAIFGGESGYKRAMQDSRVASFRNWSRLKPCSFAGCNTQSIRNSHAISSGMMRDSVTSKNHVMSPERQGSGKLIVKKLGVDEASVFPGYCQFHENLFQNFEKKSLSIMIKRFFCRYIVQLTGSFTA